MVFNSNVNEIVFFKDIMKKEIIDTKNELLCEENNILFLYYPYNYNFKFSLKLEFKEYSETTQTYC